MTKIDVVVVGAGVVGLAIARRLASRKREIVLVERHDGFGRETSSRNSEVIHAGIHYAEDLLKTRLCVRGNPLLYEFCAKKGIPHRKTGKLIVATSEDEVSRLHQLLDQGTRNGVRGLRVLGPQQIETLEPYVSALAALHSPDTGIVDSHELMSALEREAIAEGVTVAYNCTVTGLDHSGSQLEVLIRDADGEDLPLAASVVVNAAGLEADRVAEMGGLDAEELGYRIHPCKGEYFAVSNRHTGKIGCLVYPLPSPVHLGAHVVLGLDDSLKIGPSCFYVDEIDYDVDPEHQEEFFLKARRFLPFLEYEDLSPSMAGIRPKLYRTGEPFRDWVIREESDQGLPGLIDLIGIESPGLTACLAIAEMVEGVVEGIGTSKN
ncbi:MAG: NAD(P)/FAD-dependent oxidoreductase [Spirochaetales bacterium]|nr:NAD(P)/FAD-dependent oxidoreductase [Spirochaetales bacterium]